MIDLNPKTDALIVVDVQHDFLPGGALAVADGDKIIEPTIGLMSRFKTVVVTQDWHPEGHISFASTWQGGVPFTPLTIAGPDGNDGRTQMLWPNHCVAGSHGAEVHPDLDLRRATLVLRKGTNTDVDSYSAFRENEDVKGFRMPTGLAGWLKERGITRVFVCGLARDFCVAWTALDAKEAGLDVVVVDSATRAVFPDNKSLTDAAFAKAGVATVEAL